MKPVVIILLIIFFLIYKNNGKSSFNNSLKKLIVISSKSPNNLLLNCVDSLYNVQKIDKSYKVVIVDSDSKNFSNYKIVKKIYPGVEILFLKNKNYEYGAWKIAYDKYSNYDIYICIQDTLIIYNKIPINDNTTFIFEDFSGFKSHLSIKDNGINKLMKTNIEYQDIIDTPFKCALHNSFIVTKKVLQDIFKTFLEFPVNKDDSCSYERLFGLYFIKKNIDTVDLHQYMKKIHGNRN
jgi:hypothetical protein